MKFEEGNDVIVKMSDDEFLLYQLLMNQLVCSEGPDEFLNDYVVEFFQELNEVFPLGHPLRANLNSNRIRIGGYHYELLTNAIEVKFR